MSDLDQRLAAYARHLDERMDRVDPGTTMLAERPGTEVRSLRSDHEPDGRMPSHRVWLATAAAVVLLVAGSLVWWRSSTEDSTGVVDGPEVTIEPGPTGGTESAVVTWRKTDHVAGFSTPASVVGYRGGLLAISNLAVFKPFSWFSPDGQRWDDQVAMSDTAGQPTALATDGSIAVAVGDGNPDDRALNPDVVGTGASWVTADGRSWQRHEIADAASLRSVASTALGFLAVGSSRLTTRGDPMSFAAAAAWISTDGEAWTRLELPAVAVGAADASDGTLTGTPGELTAVAGSPDAAMLVGYAQAAPVALAVDRDGHVGSVPVDGVPGPNRADGPTDVAWDGERFVAAGFADGQVAGWVFDADRAVFARHDLGTLPETSQPVVIVRVAGVNGVDALFLTGARGAGPLTAIGVSAGGEVWTDATPVDVIPVPVASLTSTGDQLLAISAGGDVFVGDVGG